MLCFISIKM
jgi:hypothetical protein